MHGLPLGHLASLAEVAPGICRNLGALGNTTLLGAFLDHMDASLPDVHTASAIARYRFEQAWRQRAWGTSTLHGTGHRQSQIPSTIADARGGVGFHGAVCSALTALEHGDLRSMATTLASASSHAVHGLTSSSVERCV